MPQQTNPVGLKSPPRSYVLDDSWIKPFQRAIPTWDGFDPWSETPIPFTYAASLTPWPILGFDLPQSGLIHGEQRFRYGIAMHVGMQITVVQEVTGFKVRGQTAFVTLTSRGTTNEGNLVFESESLILSPRVEEESSDAERN